MLHHFYRVPFRYGIPVRVLDKFVSDCCDRNVADSHSQCLFRVICMDAMDKEESDSVVVAAPSKEKWSWFAAKNESANVTNTNDENVSVDDANKVAEIMTPEVKSWSWFSSSVVKQTDNESYKESIKYSHEIDIKAVEDEIFSDQEFGDANEDTPAASNSGGFSSLFSVTKQRKNYTVKNFSAIENEDGQVELELIPDVEGKVSEKRRQSMFQKYLSNFNDEDEATESEVEENEYENYDDVELDKLFISPCQYHKFDNYYDVLNISVDAHTKDIVRAYKSLSRKYQPEKYVAHMDSIDSKKAIEMYKLVVEAYKVLSDPNLRLLVDQTLEHRLFNGNNETHAKLKKEIRQKLKRIIDDGPINPESLSHIGRVFGTIYSNSVLYVDRNSLFESKQKKVIEQAKNICTSPDFLIAFNELTTKDDKSNNERIMSITSIFSGDSSVSKRKRDFIPLKEGSGLENEKVNRTQTNFYRFDVDRTQCHNGIIISCRSSSKGCFRLLLFNASGELVKQQASGISLDKAYNEVVFYFTRFDTYTVEELPIQEKLCHEETNPEYIFEKVKSVIQTKKKKMSEGKYLLAVFGDNFIGYTKYNIQYFSLTTDINRSETLAKLKQSDEEFLAYRPNLDSLSTEYYKVKKMYDDILERMAEEKDIIDSLLLRKYESYRHFHDEAIMPYRLREMDEKTQLELKEKELAAKEKPKEGLAFMEDKERMEKKAKEKEERKKNKRNKKNNKKGDEVASYGNSSMEVNGDWKALTQFRSFLTSKVIKGSHLPTETSIENVGVEASSNDAKITTNSESKKGSFFGTYF